MRSLRQYFSLWPRNKRRSPKFDSRSVGNILLQAYSIGSGYIDSIGYGMAFHHIHPSTVLIGPVLLFFLWMPAYGCRVKQYLSSLKCRQSSGLRIPLVPANQGSYFSFFRRKGFEPGISRRKIKLFVKMRIIWNMHLAVETRIGAVGIDDVSAVVVDSRHSFFEERYDDDHTQFLSHCTERIKRNAIKGFRQRKHIGVLALAKIMAAIQFRKADHICTLIGSITDPTQTLFKVVLWDIIKIKLYNGNFIHILGDYGMNKGNGKG